jgi:hypothetical protein
MAPGPTAPGSLLDTITPASNFSAAEVNATLDCVHCEKSFEWQLYEVIVFILYALSIEVERFTDLNVFAITLPTLPLDNSTILGIV